jgi:hypothetical protein
MTAHTDGMQIQSKVAQDSFKGWFGLLVSAAD